MKTFRGALVLASCLRASDARRGHVAPARGAFTYFRGRVVDFRVDGPNG
jgi:hypothetical protein